MANRRGSMEVVTGFLFLGSKITVDGDCSHETRRWLLLGRKAMTDLGSVLKNRDVTLPTNVRQGCGLPSGHVWLWELGHKEGRASTNWRLQTMALEKTLEGPLDSKDITPVNLKGEQPWILIGRTDAGAPGLWSSDANNQLVAKVPSAGKDWVQKDKRVSEDETAGWHHQGDGHELGQTPGDGQGQRRLCAAVHGVSKSRTWLANWTTTMKMIVHNDHLYFLSSFQIYTEICISTYTKKPTSVIGNSQGLSPPFLPFTNTQKNLSI